MLLCRGILGLLALGFVTSCFVGFKRSVPQLGRDVDGAQMYLNKKGNSY